MSPFESKGPVLAGYQAELGRRKRHVCVVITARPSYARVKTALLAMMRRPEIELSIVAMGSMLLERFGTPVGILEADGMPVVAKVHMLLDGETPIASAKSTGLAMIDLASVFDRLGPDVVVSIADRYETLASAVTAAYMNIPLAHIQGGEVTGNIDEKVRHAVTKLADLHFTATELARQRVLKMGERPESVYFTGCPSIDLVENALEQVGLDFDQFAPYGGVGAQLDLADDYLIVMQHPVTTEHAQARSQVEETLNAIKSIAMPTIWFWPNPDPGSAETSKGIRIFRELDSHSNVHFFKNMPPESFLRLLSNARCIVGNSSVALREAAYMGVPAINIGGRQAGRERGRNVLDVEYDRDSIVQAIGKQVIVGRYPKDHLYGDGQAGERIAELLATAPLTNSKQLTY